MLKRCKMTNKISKERKEYIANWTKANTKCLAPRYSKDDEIWEAIQFLKKEGIVIKDFIKDAILDETNKRKAITR